MTERKQPPRPDAVLLGTYRWALSYDAEWLDTTDKRAHGEASRHQLQGATHKDSQTIYVRPLASGDQTADTVVHELLHAALHTGGLDTDGDVEEEYVRALTPYVLAMVRDEQLVAWLRDPH